MLTLLLQYPRLHPLRLRPNSTHKKFMQIEKVLRKYLPKYINTGVSTDRNDRIEFVIASDSVAIS